MDSKETPNTKGNDERSNWPPKTPPQIHRTLSELFLHLERDRYERATGREWTYPPDVTDEEMLGVKEEADMFPDIVLSTNTETADETRLSIQQPQPPFKLPRPETAKSKTVEL